VRREMLLAIRTEDEEAWQDLEFFDGEVGRRVILHISVSNAESARQQNLKVPLKLSSHKMQSH
jgi:hypothetical protein